MASNNAPMIFFENLSASEKDKQAYMQPEVELNLSYFVDSDFGRLWFAKLRRSIISQSRIATF